MSLYIILFFIALIAAVTLIGRRVWQLRTGRVTIDPSFEPADWTDLSIESIRGRLVELIKFSIHYTALFFLKLWIITSHMVKRLDGFVHSLLTKILHKNGHRPITTDTIPSEFMQDMHSHKEEISQAMQKEALENDN